MPLVVYKLGGSLLDLPDSAGRLRSVLAQRPATDPLLIVGGGAAADLVRQWDQRHQLGEERSHWLALQAMQFNAELLRALLPEAELAATREDVAAVLARGNLPLLNAHTLLRQVDCEPDALPHTWDSTSDSVAAWVARRWQAVELVLLKSCDLPQGLSVHDAAQAHLVDAAFPNQAAGLPRVSWCNLRTTVTLIRPWMSTGK